MKIVTPAALLLAMAVPATAAPAARTPAPALTARVVHVEVSDPGDPSGGTDLTTSVIGDRGCTSSTTEDGATRRQVEVCTDGSAARPVIHLRIKRTTAGHTVDVQFSAAVKPGARVRLGKLRLDARQSLEAHVTVDAATP